MDRSRDQLLTGSPLECLHDQPDPPVDLIPAKARVDHRLACRLEPERPELSGRSQL
jgi:hypothetical protein